MRDLETRLRALGEHLELPPAPDLSAAVAARLRAAPARRRSRPRVLALAAAVLAALLAAALAVPQARTALLELLRLRGAEVQRVETVPPARPGAPLAPGEPVTLAEARRAVDFPVLVPAEAGCGTVRLDRSIPGCMVSVVCRRAAGALVLTQFRGQQTPFVLKLVGPSSDAVEVDVGRGARGIWIEGAPHVLLFRDANGEVREETRRLAGDVLLWERDGVTYRLEGALGGREAAVRLARDLR
ncbi:MAG TPA: hypothetical protein VM290_12005 [Gaiellaceae bacterium]|nr:hypothetical protein [Gaiellaceae bacterium]